MKPVLYSKNASSWADLGLGRLSDCTSCFVTEKRNGAYELAMKYPVSGVHFGEIEKGMLIKAKPNDFSEPQMFRIYKISKPMNDQVTISAEHISYELNGMAVPSLILSNTTPTAAVTAGLAASLPSGGGYSFWSDISTRASVAIRTPRSMRAILGGVDGSILDVWGGEYEFDNRTIRLHSSRGSDRGVKIKYGRNLLDLKQEESIERMYTHVFPFVRVNDGDTETIISLPNNEVIDLGNSATLGFSRCLQLDLTDEFDNDAEITEAAIRAKTTAYISSHKLTVPAVSLSVSFYALRNADEYKDLPTLEQIKLCDTVHVEFEELGVTADAKVIATKYDVLRHRYESIELGDARSTFAETIANQHAQIEAIKTQIPRQISKASAMIDERTKAFAGAMYNGLGLYSTVYNGVTYFHDTPVLQDADYIITINTAGVAFAKTEGGTSAWNDGSPNWLYGVDADGGGILASLLVRTLIADIITSGKLQSVDGSVYFDLDAARIHTESSNGEVATNLSAHGINVLINVAEPQTITDLIRYILNGLFGTGILLRNTNAGTLSMLGTLGLWFYDGTNYSRYTSDRIIIHGNDLLYKAGDTYSGTCYATGFVTSANKTSLMLVFPVDRMIPGGLHVAISSITLAIRLPTGGYLESSGYDATSLLQAAVPIGASIRVYFEKSGGWNVPNNNIPVSGQVTVDYSIY